MKNVFITIFLGLFLVGCDLFSNDNIPQENSNTNNDRERSFIDDVIDENRERYEALEKLPKNAKEFHGLLHRSVRNEYGLSNPPVAIHGALIHQESRWNPQAESPVGAQGIAQFMPRTGEWLSEEMFPQELGNFQPFNLNWSFPAVAKYTNYLKSQIEPLNNDSLEPKNHWAFVLSSYNGGIGWLNRDRSLTQENSDNPDIWFDNVENYSNRHYSAFEENRHYVEVILKKHRPLYIRAGWNYSY